MKRQFPSIIQRAIATFAVLCSFASGAGAQQTASTVEPPRTVDLQYRPAIDNARYASGEGPRVLIDEAHNNFHTAWGGYLPFARVLENDGYIVEGGATQLSPEILTSYQVLVIAVAQPPQSVDDAPTFSQTEIAQINAWVREGGSLFLITDHMPDPAAVVDLAASFGVEVHDGYVLGGPPHAGARPLIFRRSDGTVVDDPITQGLNDTERVSQVATFAGAAFRAGENFRPLLLLAEGTVSWAPEEYWRITEDSDRLDVSGWYQGGVVQYGDGRLAVFGEAAMFTAQVFNNGQVKAGMNNEIARDNLRLLLNVVHWLTESD